MCATAAILFDAGGASAVRRPLSLPVILNRALTSLMKSVVLVSRVLARFEQFCQFVKLFIFTLELLFRKSRLAIQKM